MKKEFSTNDHIHPDNGKNPHNQDLSLIHI